MVCMEAVTRRYRVGGQTIRALDGVSFEVPRGQFMAIVGPSGSGKSTLDRPDGGRYLLDGDALKEVRARSLGLTIAIGARRQDIVVRFLREAVVICASGASIGLLFGALLAYAIATFAGWKVAWEPLGIFASVTACLLIGLAFSIYPARQAAALDPIAAIRDE